ncbi:hypothetical protein ACFE04_007372 [Oxalis oulophora]
MEVLNACYVPSFNKNIITSTYITTKPIFFNFNSLKPNTKFSSKSKLFISPTQNLSTTEESIPLPTESEKFDWYSHWYPLMFVCDLDKNNPHSKTVMGIDVVVLWDQYENAWKVFDDICSLSDARVYPTIVHHDIVWFWPNSDPRYKDIFATSKPPFIPELANPSYVKQSIIRDMPYGFEVLVENLLDPAHVAYAHNGLMPTIQLKEKVDHEGGRPLNLRVEKLNKNGFIGKVEGETTKFMAPGIVSYYSGPLEDQGNDFASSPGTRIPQSSSKKLRRFATIFICIPVSPGKSRMLMIFAKNFSLWVDKIVPRWLFHIGQNLIVDSDLLLVHVQEQRLKVVAPAHRQKAYFVPTKSDAFVVSMRKWLNKYADGQVDWKGKFTGDLPPTPPRKKLMDRYWSHVANCSSCSSAYKGLNVLELALQVICVISVGIVGCTYLDSVLGATRATLVYTAILCFLASRFLAYFIYKSFHCHDYDHAFRAWPTLLNAVSVAPRCKGLQVLEIALQVISILSAGIAVCAYPSLISPTVRFAIASTAILCFFASRYLGYFIYKSFCYHGYDHAFRGQQNLVTFLKELFS